MIPSDVSTKLLDKVDAVEEILKTSLKVQETIADARATTDVLDCDDCGDCVDRCHFGAREMVNGVMVFKSEMCFGCGLCVSTCPTNARARVKTATR